MTIFYTLGFVCTQDQVLLGYKVKSGLGQDQWNGYGGKTRADESLLDCLRRELWEEACIVPVESHACGELVCSFSSPSDSRDTQHVIHLFTIPQYTGEPTETAEMRPQWFAFKQIPYAQMWSTDRLWLPQVLAGKHVKGIIHYADPQTVRDLSLVIT